MMDATLYLEMESFRKRIACAVAIKLMCFTVEELKEEYELNDYNIEDETLRNENRPLIEELKKNYME